MEKRKRFPWHKDYIEEAELSSITLSTNQKTSAKDYYDSLKGKTPSITTLQTSLEDNNLEYDLDKIVGHRRSPTETLYCVRLYGYNARTTILMNRNHTSKHPSCLPTGARRQPPGQVKFQDKETVSKGKGKEIVHIFRSKTYIFIIKTVRAD